MKTTTSIFLIILVLLFAVLGVLKVTDSISASEFKDWATKITLVLVILYAASTVVQMITKKQS